jgi:hypothetical protein
MMVNTASHLPDPTCQTEAAIPCSTLGAVLRLLRLETLLDVDPGPEMDGLRRSVNPTELWS